MKISNNVKILLFWGSVRTPFLGIVVPPRSALLECTCTHNYTDGNRHGNRDLYVVLNLFSRVSSSWNHSAQPRAWHIMTVQLMSVEGVNQ